jgi:hypothetical protein
MQNRAPVSTINLPTIPIQLHIGAAVDFLGTGRGKPQGWNIRASGE